MKDINKPKILVVDDEEHICDLITSYFNEEYDTAAVHDGQAAVEDISKTRYDLIILDLMLPGLNGWDICRQIRVSSDVPIIMLTAKDDEIDKVLGLELGADDYVTKPFNLRELLARTRAVLKRTGRIVEEDTNIITFPGITVNKTSRKVFLNKEEVELTPKEFDLLWLFAVNPGMVFSRDHLIKSVWGYDYNGDTRTIDNTVKRLRRKLEAVPGAPFYIHTVWGVGYKFEAPQL